jgi:NADH dehydrogenase
MAKGVVTIFGGSGFIGRYVVKRLARQGWRIRVAVRHPGPARFLKPMGEVGQITPIRAKLQDQAAVAEAVAGAQAVINLVGILYEKRQCSFEDIHHRGAERIAKAAAAAGATALVQISALGADPDSQAAYARSKAAGEAAVLAAFPTASVIRPSVVFGAEDGFLNLFAGLARLSPVLPLMGGGKTKFQPVYVGDVADAVVTCMTDPKCRGKTYELGGPTVYSFEELMRYMLKEIRRRRFLVPWPFELADFQAKFLEMLPVPPLTRDQVKLLQSDNVVSEGALTLADLGLQPTALEVIAPTYLERYRPHGRFTQTLAV